MQFHLNWVTVYDRLSKSEGMIELVTKGGQTGYEGGGTPSIFQPKIFNDVFVSRGVINKFGKRVRTIVVTLFRSWDDFSRRWRLFILPHAAKYIRLFTEKSNWYLPYESSHGLNSVEEGNKNWSAESRDHLQHSVRKTCTNQSFKWQRKCTTTLTKTIPEFTLSES